MRLQNIFATMLAMTTTLMVMAQGPANSEPVIKYPLTAKEGPWLIHIGSFRGDESLDFAHRLAEEARTKHRLLTFVYSMHEDDAVKDRAELREQQLKLVGTDKVPESNERMKFKTVRVVKEYSVFVGNFADMDKAREETDRIKAFAPPSSIPTYGVHLYKEPTSRARSEPVDNGIAGVFGLRTPTGTEEGKRLKEFQGNPYRQAFVARNPIITKAQAQNAARITQAASIPMDPTWKELNEKEKHSIFTCPKNWTLVVAQFSPPTEVDSTNRSVVQTGFRVGANDLGKGLERAAETARQVAELLRDGGKGYDAYVFHTRQYSLVTVGAFDARYDPKMEQAWTILKDFAESQSTGPFSLLMKMPRPMQIPGR